MKIKFQINKNSRFFKIGSPCAMTLVIALGLSLSQASRAEDSMNAPQKRQEMRQKITKEKREKMAAAHDKMATCLRSDRPFSECHDEMRKEMQQSMPEGMRQRMNQRMQDRKGPHPTEDQ